ncbi:hypothetical protein [Aestuariibius sp. HNIBRBA575]|uniref:hypothetical protein n=1 Tax=Aestuariibius sp. HNIBRBA575 TaxID=3233343 RepID=UPI0034A242CF
MYLRVALCLALITPTHASAYDFGFVRGPDWMDSYLLVLLVTTVCLMAATLVFIPLGASFNEMYKLFQDFSKVGRITYVAFGVSFGALMIMVFLGMGLQRAAEAGL